MKNAWKALAGVAVAAALVIAPLVTAGAMADETGAEAAPAEVVPDSANTEIVPEAVVETLPEAVVETLPEAAPAATPLMMGTCSSDAAFATSTNLNSQGWSFKPNHAGASYVDGGLSLDATIAGGGSSWAKVTLPAGTHLSEIGDLTTHFASKSSAGWGGIILEGGELTQQLHYDEDGRFWTQQPGIFQAERAGYYQSFPIDGNGANVPTSTPELLSNPIIGTLRIYINEGQKVVVASQSYACGTQAFDHATIAMGTCSSDAAFATSTNLNSQGWSFKPNHAGASYVDGGLSLDATLKGAGGSWAIKTLPAGTHLSQIGDLTTTFASKSSTYWGGIILEGGDLTAQLHHDDNGRFWTTQSGIFEAERAGYYQSFPIVSGADQPTNTPELLSDPIVDTIKIYVNEGQKVVVASQAYVCGTQAFNHANPIVMGTCAPQVTHATSTNLASQGWSFKPNHAGASYVEGGLSLDATINGGGSSWAILPLPAGTHLSQIGDLTTTFASKSSSNWGGIILEGGELTAQLHHDDNGRFWTTQAGIFAADRAGYYQSFPIDQNGMDVATTTAELLSDPIIGTLKIYINAGQQAVVETQSYLCGTQAFDYATAPVVTDPGNTDPGNTDPGNTNPSNTDPGTVTSGTTDPDTAATSAGSLAATGGPNMAPWWIGAAALLLTGAALITLRRVTRA